MSIKNFNDTIGNRTRDLLACSAVCIYKSIIYLFIYFHAFVSENLFSHLYVLQPKFFFATAPHIVVPHVK